ncbi:inositol monophosphatase family protein [Brooklawnia cerclae]|uniref:Fructose-1,6-bisphosphatase/inositol monophosphatase family enzyme n=1 Tax=Brooklawnia cerclae TaxID=349934 RepID=A0ABX0SGL9_9ACTN|nr:inositol monophosphatase [Brooklawnia cerclae]NIH57059.1 fructose-1,6-bisphosphatase/inositol monophosphatase family enzyme [Brooklawnia cerclae]
MQTDEVLELIQHVAAEVINPRFHALASGDIEQKSPGDFVTIADREAEQLLTAELRAREPGCLVVGEEATFANPDIPNGLADAEVAYTVDPVDGTGNFVHGSPKHAVMIAELRRGEVTRSWIWQPQLNNAWVAERGAGVTHNGELVTRGPINQRPLGATSRRGWHGYDAGGRLAPVTDASFCAGVDYPMLAMGEIDFLTYLRPKPWDHMPGYLIVTELGGTTLDVEGRPYGPDTPYQTTIVAAASPELAQKVADLWRPQWDR